MRFSLATFNLRLDNDWDEQMRFDFRKGRILDRIEAEAPDVIGFQECLPSMAAFLRRHLTDYICVGCARAADYTDECNMIALRKDKFELIATDTFWLSPTPFAPGTRYEEQSICPRVCTHALLRLWGTTELVHIYNTHLDHESDAARMLGAQQILERIEADQQRWPFPLALTGDMNAYPDSAPIALFTASLTDQTDGIVGSYHDYNRKPGLPRIDYILTRGLRATSEVKAWDEALHGVPLSDHNPLSAELETEATC